MHNFRNPYIRNPAGLQANGQVQGQQNQNAQQPQGQQNQNGPQGQGQAPGQVAGQLAAGNFGGPPIQRAHSHARGLRGLGITGPYRDIINKQYRAQNRHKRLNEDFVNSYRVPKLGKIYADGVFLHSRRTFYYEILGHLSGI